MPQFGPYSPRCRQREDAANVTAESIEWHEGALSGSLKRGRNMKDEFG